MILSYTFVSVLHGEYDAERFAEKWFYCDYFERYCDMRHNFSENGNFSIFLFSLTDMCWSPYQSSIYRIWFAGQYVATHFHYIRKLLRQFILCTWPYYDFDHILINYRAYKGTLIITQCMYEKAWIHSLLLNKISQDLLHDSTYEYVNECKH